MPFCSIIMSCNNLFCAQVGIRYKCTVRYDFNLCENCEAKSKHPFPLDKIADDPEKTKLLVDILQSLGSGEEDPLGRFDAMYCLHFKAGNDGWSAEQLREHVSYCYDSISHIIMSAGADSVITREHFNMLTTLSDPDMFNHGDSSKLLACLLMENHHRVPVFESDADVVMQLGDKVLYSGSDEQARRVFAIALFQRAVEQQLDREVKLTSFSRQLQV